MAPDQRRRAMRQTLMDVANLVIGLVLLVTGIAPADWVRLVTGGLLVLVSALALWLERGAAPHSPGSSVDEARPDVMSVAVAGHQIKAVKVLRERTGLGLVEATETVRRWLEEEGIAWR